MTLQSSAYSLQRDLIGHSAPINAVRFTLDGNYCITCSDDRSLKLWNPHKDDPERNGQALTIKTYDGVHGYSILDATISHDNSKFASAGGDRSAFLWDVGTGRVIRRIQGHNQRINTIKMNEDSTVLLTGSYDKTLRIWDLRSNTRDAIQILDDFKDSVTSIERTQYEIITGCVDGKIRIYDIRAGMLQSDDLKDPISSISLTNDKKCVLSACIGGTLRLTELSSGTLLQFYSGHINTSFKVETCVANDDGRILAGSEDGSFITWDLVDAHILNETKAHKRPISSIRYHPSLPMVITASFDNTAKCWKDNYR
eukprot:gene4380-8723_t